MAPHTHAHICRSAHARCSKPIIQSERVHKFSSLVAAACPVKVRALFLSKPRRLTDPCFLCLHLCNSSLPAGLLTPRFFFCFSSLRLVSILYDVRPRARNSAASRPRANVQLGKFDSVSSFFNFIFSWVIPGCMLFSFARVTLCYRCFC